VKRAPVAEQQQASPSPAKGKPFSKSASMRTPSGKPHTPCLLSKVKVIHVACSFSLPVACCFLFLALCVFALLMYVSAAISVFFVCFF
jgi:hypothetical protein